MVRLFVAAWPSTEVRRNLALIPRPSEPGVRWVPDEKWHITLRFIGDADPDAVSARLSETELRRAVAHLGPAAEPLGRYQIVVPVAGVDALAGAVRSATSGIGETDPHPFRGHLTIARITDGARPSVVGTPVEGDFEITEIALVVSDRLPDGAVYTTVERFPTS